MLFQTINLIKRDFKIQQQKKKTTTFKPTKLALITIALCLLICSLIGIIIILIGDFGELEFKTLGTAATLAGFSIVSLPSLFNIERLRHELISKFGFISCIVFFSLLLILIWIGDPENGEIFFKILVTFGIFSFSINHILLILIVKPLKILITITQRLTISSINLLSLLLLLAIWTEDLPEILARISAAIAIIIALGTISLPILSRINTKNT